ncbi:hypothetical protein BDR07DRAFT_1493914 [Suillus spraguei]|nr:hypothetical protein BDR07DRAFT_1493914 [Suillus spraguei]
MELRFAKKHIETVRHECHVEKARNGQMASLNPVFKAQPVNKSLKKPNRSIMKFGLSRHSFMDADDFSMEMGIHDTPNTMDLEIPLSKFLDDITRSRTVEFSEGVTNVFAELQETLASGQVPFSTPLAPITEDDKLVDYGAPDFGIEIPDIDFPETRAILGTDSPTYPWPSQADFVTALLFSSPCLPFSDAQKKATLNWAKELDLLGQPTEKVTAQSRNTFYINNIAKAISHDYGNPLTRFAMQDHPEDGGKGMSQVFNGDYFIPEHFFLGSSSVDDDLEHCEKPDAKILYALGRAVQRTDAGFIVNNEQEIIIIPTSMFVWSYEDTMSMGELDCSLTASSVQYASLAPNPLHEKAQG